MNLTFPNFSKGKFLILRAVLTKIHGKEIVYVPYFLPIQCYFAWCTNKNLKIATDTSRCLRALFQGMGTMLFKISRASSTCWGTLLRNYCSRAILWGLQRRKELRSSMMSPSELNEVVMPLLGTFFRLKRIEILIVLLFFNCKTKLSS